MSWVGIGEGSPALVRGYAAWSDFYTCWRNETKRECSIIAKLMKRLLHDPIMAVSLCDWVSLVWKRSNEQPVKKIDHVKSFHSWCDAGQRRILFICFEGNTIKMIFLHFSDFFYLFVIYFYFLSLFTILSKLIIFAFSRFFTFYDFTKNHFLVLDLFSTFHDFLKNHHFFGPVFWSLFGPVFWSLLDPVLDPVFWPLFGIDFWGLNIRLWTPKTSFSRIPPTPHFWTRMIRYPSYY